MQIAYLILAHAQPEQLGRLAARLAAPGVRLYLHIDANTPDDIHHQMQSVVARVPVQAVWVDRQPCRWGGFSLVQATLRLLRSALADGCDWMVLLSGQDYPLQTHETIVSRLASGPAGFIDLRDIRQFDTRYRYEAFHFEALNGTSADRLLQKLQRQLNRMGLRRRLPHPIKQVHAGSQWWMLGAPACRWLLEFCNSHPGVMAFFRRTLVPDEMFFQTLLAHSPLACKLSHDPLRQIVWDEGSWSPRTFAENDLPTLLTSPALFARKFAPDGKVATLVDAARRIVPGSSC